MSNSSLNEFIYKIDRPCLFKNALKPCDDGSNSAVNWTLDNLASVFENERFTFRIGSRAHLNKIQFENECDYVEATIGQFNEWLNFCTSACKKNAQLSEGNPFEEFDLEEYWAYADYKYMIDFIDPNKSTINQNCIEWGKFGFGDRNARDSTLWIGTAGAYTPCHYDTYGYNFVAQIFGKKKWTLFPKSDISFMYPRRIPYEESTVYTSVNLKSPNLDKHPLFKNSTPHVVELEPGDVLYVPPNWWHHVECLNDAISINTWVDMEADNHSRLKEIVTKTIIQSMMDSNLISFENWLNSSEAYNTQEENMQKVSHCLDAINSRKVSCEPSESSANVSYESILCRHEHFAGFVEPISFASYLEKHTQSIGDCADDLLDRESMENVEDTNRMVMNLCNAIADPSVVEAICNNFLKSSIF